MPDTRIVIETSSIYLALKCLHYWETSCLIKLTHFIWQGQKVILQQNSMNVKTNLQKKTSTNALNFFIFILNIFLDLMINSHTNKKLHVPETNLKGGKTLMLTTKAFHRKAPTLFLAEPDNSLCQSRPVPV